MIPYQTMDDMKRAVRCKYCGKPEFYGEFRWKDGKMMCRSCYRADYERVYGKPLINKEHSWKRNVAIADTWINPR